MAIVNTSFFNRDACDLAGKLLGTIIRRKYRGQWLAARIIETEAYYLHEKGSHASLGVTQKRRALFMPAGTIYMYYAHGKDSLNISCMGAGNAVLIKSAFPYEDEFTHPDALNIMQSLNPLSSGQARAACKLCAGQTLLCRSLDLRVTDWDQQKFQRSHFYFDAIGSPPECIIQTTRLGITKGRDEHLHYRFVDYGYAKYCTSNPLSKRGWTEGEQYCLLDL
jgi:DNA-3-methyladenine glycosylase